MARGGVREAGTGGSQRTGGDHTIGLLFVCLGNICRSPTAEAVMRSLVREAGLEGAIELDSAGTAAEHVGSPPDARAVAAAGARGIALVGFARQVSREDFEDFDVVLAMDRANTRTLRRLAPGDRERAKVRLLREFDPASAGDQEPEIPDPYYGGPGGFDEVFDLVLAACRGLLAQIVAGKASE
jgi:protein-tyrosine phosphatase